MELSKEQKEIVTAPIEEKTIVMSCPASGKTRCLVERLEYLLKNYPDKKIVAITYTNNAAAEIKLRLAENNIPFEKLFVGTLHSYANRLLTSCGVKTSVIIESEEFDQLFDLIIENPHVIEKIDYLLCDEFQDLNSFEFSFITEMIPYDGCLFVGDIRQSIYGFKGADPEQLINLMEEEQYTIRNLTRNYRNSKKIFDYSVGILNSMRRIWRGSKDSRPMITKEGRVAKMEKRDLYDMLESVPEEDLKNWVVICRSNKEIRSVMNALKNRGIPNQTFKQGDNSLEQLKEKINKNEIKVLTVHSCVTGDTIVITPEGEKTIKEVCEAPFSNNLIYNGEKFETPTKYIKNPMQLIFSLKTNYGSELKCTLRHGCYVLNNKGGIERKTLSELRVGDEVLRPKNCIYNKINDTYYSKNIINILKEHFPVLNLYTEITDFEFEQLYRNNKIKFCINKDLRNIKNIFDKYYIEQIQEIKYIGQEETYCLTMPSGKFLQNGLLMGNCKGLEFDKVFVCKSVFSGNLEEDKRLRYVAVTRARNLLMIER